jgi:hypothetical protein
MEIDPATALDTAAGAAASLVSAGSDPITLRRNILLLQHHLDQIRVTQSRLIADAEQRQAWVGTGARSMADWLAGKTNSSYGDAKKKSKLGEALGSSKALDDAVSSGSVSPDAAEALHDAVTNPPAGADVGELVDAVKGAGPKDAKDAAELWKRLHTTESEDEVADRRYQARSIRFGQPAEGLIDTLVRLPERETAEFRATISAIAGKPSADDGRTTEQRLADGLIQLCAAYAKGDVRGGREGANLLITFTADAYTGASNEPATTAHGDRIPAHIARQMAENATIQRILISGSHVLDLGRRERYATVDQYKALVVRDGGCRWPGCNIPAAWCDIDHITPFEHGGTTDLSNLAMLCRHHHTTKHRPGVTTTGDATTLVIILADGTPIHCTPPAATRPRTQAAA